MEWEDLARHPLFRRVDGELLRETLARSQLRCVDKGETVYDRRRFRRCLGVLLRGKLQARRETLLVSTLRPGELFGAAALFNERED